MTRVYVSIGSNHNCEHNMAHAVARLRKIFGSVQCSSAYRSAAVNGRGPDYENMVVSFEVQLPLPQLHRMMQDIEAELGRDRTQAELVSMDLDILLYGDTTGPRLPHPDLFRCPHVLRPMADIAADLLPPGSGKTIKQLLALAPHNELEHAGEY